MVRDDVEQQAQLPFVLPDLLLGLLPIVDVRPGPVPTNDPSLVVLQWVHANQEPAVCAVLPQNTGLHLERRALRERSLSRVPQTLQIVGMVDHAVGELGVEGNVREHVAVVFENRPVGVLVGHVRAQDEDLLGHDVEELAELVLLLPDLLLCLMQILDVEHDPVPSDDGARGVELGEATREVPAILSVGAADAKDVLVGLGERQPRAPVRQDAGGVVGMDVGAPTEAWRIPVLRRTVPETEELGPSSIDEIDGAVGPRSPDELRDAIEDLLQLLGTSPGGVRRLPEIRDLAGVPQRDRRLRGKQLHHLDPARREGVWRRTLEVERAEQLGLRGQWQTENRARRTVAERHTRGELSRRRIVQQHPVASACQDIQNCGRCFDRRHRIVVQAHSRAAVHHGRLRGDLRRAIPQQDEQTPRGRGVLESERQSPVDQRPEHDLPGHALHHSNAGRKIR